MITLKRAYLLQFKLTSVLFVLTAENGGRLFALSFMNLTNSALAFEQIFISSFNEATLVSISIPQINYFEVTSLDSSNNFTFTKNIMEDISVPLDVSRTLQFRAV